MVHFVSVEHPIYTSRNEQDWVYDENGNRLHWAVDHYQTEGIRETTFLTENVIKYHRTLSTYMNVLIQAGFTISAVKEPMPSEEMLKIFRTCRMNYGDLCFNHCS